MRLGKPGERMRWHAIIDRCPNATRGAELGVLSGTLSRELLAALPSLHLYLVDRWAEYPEERKLKPSPVTRQTQEYFDDALDACRANVAPYSDRVTFLQYDTIEAAGYVDGGLDFVFVDADHTYQGVLDDVNAWVGKVKKGGWILGHDYNSKRHAEVKRAVDKLFGRRVEVDTDHVWAVRL